MSNNERTETAEKPNIVAAKFIFLGGGGMFVISLLLYVLNYLKSGMALFIMCVGFGLIFVASGSNADVRAKANSAATAHWLGGFAFPLIRFTGGVAIAVILMGVLFLLGPGLSIDSEKYDNYARIVIRASDSLAPYNMWASTDKAVLVGAVRRKPQDSAPIDFEFITFASDLAGGATSLEIYLKSSDPQKTADFISDIRFLDLPLDLVRFGKSVRRMDLDLTTSALRDSDGKKCYFDTRQKQQNPCLKVAQSGESRVTEIKPWFDGISVISKAVAQSNAQEITTAGLGDLSPVSRTQAYSQLLAKGTAIFPVIANDLPDLQAKWLANRNDVSAYYQLLGTLDLAVELTDRGDSETRLFRTAVADNMRKNPNRGLMPARALAELAAVDDRSVRLSATRTLANVIDNNTVADVLEVLKAGVNDNGQFNLLQVLDPVSGFACRENADAILASLDLIEKRINQAPPDQYVQTKNIVGKLKQKMVTNQNKNIDCDRYWKSLGGGQVIRQ